MRRDILFVGLIMVATIGVLVAGHAGPLLSGILVVVLGLVVVGLAASGRL